MRKSKAETAATREKIVAVASEAFRSRGIDATGVAEVMASAGLTHGGFYRHFESKEQLVAEAMLKSLGDLVAQSEAAAAQGSEAVRKHFQTYVTAAYRDDREHGCPLAANGSELVRSDVATRRGMTEGFTKIFKALAPSLRRENDDEPIDTAIGIVTNMVGALTVARLVDDPKLSERILRVTRERIGKAIVPPARSSSRKRAA